MGIVLSPVNVLDDSVSVSVSSEYVGGIIYVYKNNRLTAFKLNVSSSDVVDVLNISEGDSFYCIVYKDREFSLISNIEISFLTQNIPQGREKFYKSKFSKIIDHDSQEVLDWKENVLNKLIDSGIVPEYIERDSSYDQESDYVDFWKSIVELFSFYVGYSNKASKGFYNNVAIITTFLQQRGLFLNYDETLTQLRDLMESFYKEVSMRGTILPFLEDGEFIRLIKKDISDEFVFELFKKEHFGWNLDNSSPLYRGFIHVSDFSEKIKNRILPHFGSILKTEDESGNIDFDINSTNYLGFNSVNQNSEFINIDPRLDYCLNFKIKGSGKLTIKARGYDAFGNYLGYLYSLKTGLESEIAIDQELLQNENEYFPINLFIFNKDKENDENYSIIDGLEGTHLKSFNNCTNLVFEIKSTDGSLNVFNLKFSNLITNYSRGFVQVNNFISLILNNRSDNSIDQVEEHLRSKFIPYNSHFKLSQSSDINYLNTLDCAGTQNTNFQKSGKIRCVKYLGANTGRYEEEFIDLNNCTSNESYWILNDEYDFEKCYRCFPNGAEIEFENISCDCTAIDFDDLGCDCLTLDISDLSCSCELNPSEIVSGECIHPSRGNSKIAGESGLYTNTEYVFSVETFGLKPTEPFSVTWDVQNQSGFSIVSSIGYRIERSNLYVNFRNIEADSIIRAKIVNACGQFTATKYVKTEKKISSCIAPTSNDLSIVLSKIIVVSGELMRTTTSVSSNVSLPFQLTYELYDSNVDMKIPFLYEENNNSVTGIFDFRITSPGTYYLKALITNVCGQSEILTQNISVT